MGHDAMESLLEAQIRAARERGAFDDLPGKGKPLELGELSSLPAATAGVEALCCGPRGRFFPSRAAAWIRAGREQLARCAKPKSARACRRPSRKAEEVSRLCACQVAGALPPALLIPVPDHSASGGRAGSSSSWRAARRGLDVVHVHAPELGTSEKCSYSIRACAANRRDRARRRRDRPHDRNSRAGSLPRCGPAAREGGLAARHLGRESHADQARSLQKPTRPQLRAGEYVSSPGYPCARRGSAPPALRSARCWSARCPPRAREPSGPARPAVVQHEAG